MNKKSHKKKKRRARSGDEGKNKENIEEPQPESKDEAVEEVIAIDDSKQPCYEVKTSEIMGRYLVASREIRPGEVIVRAEAVAVGPCSGCGLVCLACYRELDDSPVSQWNFFIGSKSAWRPCSGCGLVCLACYRELDDLPVSQCKGCKWPLCSPNCHGLGKYTGHSVYECDVLRKIPPAYGDLEDLKDCYHALMPLRCLLLKKHDPAKWEVLSTMEAHNELRKARGDIWPLNDKYVVKRLRDNWGLDFDEEEIHTICGVLEVNAFEVGGNGASARALYPAACLVAHSCVPSTTHTDAERARGRPLTVRAATRHRKGDLISLCYAYTLQGTLKRQEHIQYSKFFACQCQRCSDPTELGTRASAFRCPHCAGHVEPSRPLERSDWACGAHCGYRMTDGHVRLLINRLTDEFEQIDANDVKGFEGFLHKYRNVLHPTHYLCLSAKHSLSQLYGKVAEYMIHEMPADELQRKVAVCRDLMKAFDVIEPGYSRLRGITLYELHAPLMILTTRDFEKKAITKETLRDRLKEIVGYLQEAALILGLEPPQAPEGLMAAAARDALKKIKTWEQIIGKIS